MTERSDADFDTTTAKHSGSLQVTAIKQYAHNYTLQLTYTLGRSYDDGTVANESDSIGPQDPNNPERLAGIMSYLSGTPITVFSGIDRALTGCGNGCSGQRPNLNGDPTLPSNRSREEKIAQWFNTSPTVWTLPELGQYGSAPRTACQSCER